MSDDDKKPDANEDGEDKKSGKWSTGAKVGAAVGSAAVAAAPTTLKGTLATPIAVSAACCPEHPAKNAKLMIAEAAALLLAMAVEIERLQPFADEV